MDHKQREEKIGNSYSIYFPSPKGLSISLFSLIGLANVKVIYPSFSLNLILSDVDMKLVRERASFKISKLEQLLMKKLCQFRNCNKEATHSLNIGGIKVYYCFRHLKKVKRRLVGA